MKPLLIALIIGFSFCVHSQIENNFKTIKSLEINDLNKISFRKIEKQLFVIGINKKNKKNVIVRKYDESLNILDTKNIILDKKVKWLSSSIQNLENIEIVINGHKGKIILNSKLEILYQKFWKLKLIKENGTKTFFHTPNMGYLLGVGHNHQQRSNLFENDMCFEILYSNQNNIYQEKTDKSKIVCYKQTENLIDCKKIWEFDLTKFGNIENSTISNKIDNNIYFIINSTRNKKNVETLLCFEKNTGKVIFSLEMNINDDKNLGTLISKIKTTKNPNELIVVGNYFKQNKYKKIEDFYKNTEMDGIFIMKINKEGKILNLFSKDFQPLDLIAKDKSNFSSRMSVCNIININENDEIRTIFTTILYYKNANNPNNGYHYTHHSYLKLNRDFNLLEENTFPNKLIYEKKKDFFISDKIYDDKISGLNYFIPDYFKPNTDAADEWLRGAMAFKPATGIDLKVRYYEPNIFYDELIYSEINNNEKAMKSNGMSYIAVEGNENPIISLSNDNSLLLYSGIGIAKVTSINNSNYKYEIEYCKKLIYQNVNNSVVVDPVKSSVATIYRNENSIYLVDLTKKGKVISILEW